MWSFRHPVDEPAVPGRRGIPPCGRTIRAVAALVALVTGSAPAAAQEFGQWSWEALVEFGGRARTNFSAGQRGGRFGEKTLGLDLGMNGFIVHPAVSRFRLGLDLQFITTDSGERLDTNRTGVQSTIEIFPSGPFRGSLYYNRQLYDYGGAATEDPYALLSSPDTITTWGARFRGAQGFLSGSLLGLDRNSIDFLEPGVRRQDYQSQFYDWSRRTADFSHHLRLEHRFRDLGTVDINYDERRLNIDESGSFSPTWHFTMTGSGVRQDSESPNLKQQSVDDYQLRTRLSHDARERDLLEVAYEFGLTRPDTWAATESHGVSFSYKWRPHPMWQIGPIASYAHIATDPEVIQLPRAGVVIGWDWARQAWNSGVVARSTYGRLERDMPGMSQDERQFDGSLIGSLGHGTLEGLRKEFEVEMARNRLRILQTGPIPPPGLGIPEPGLGTEDVQRARVRLGHQWDSQFLSGWGDWNRRTTETLTVGGEVLTETVTATLQYGARRFDIKGNIADTDVEEPTAGRQSIRSLGVGASLRPWQFLVLRGSYRVDDRAVVLAPDIKGSQIEAGARWQVGLFYLDLTFLQTDQRRADGPETTLRSVTWSVSRRFGGWLPIISGPERRGVIQ